MKSYIPINCSQYDVLEALATAKMVCVIQYEDAEMMLSVEDKIKTLVTRNKEEFLILEKGAEIRLDRLISVNGKTFSGYC